MSQSKKITPETVIPEVENVNFKSYDEFYKSIPYEGSLGILALGSLGLQAWRKKRAEIDAKKRDQFNH